MFALKATRFSGQRYLVSNFSCTRSACEATDELDSAVGHSSLALQKILQAQVLLLESFRVIHSHVTVMPGLPLVSGLLFAFWIGQNKPVFPGVMLEPPVSTRLCEGLQTW